MAFCMSVRRAWAWLWNARQQLLLAKVLRSDSVEIWSVDHVVIWLGMLGLGQYESVSRLNAVNGMMLLNITEEDMQRNLRMSTAHAESMIAGLALLHGHYIGAEPAQTPATVINFVRWGWSVHDVGRWLDYLGLGTLRVPLAQRAAHGGRLFNIDAHNLRALADDVAAEGVRNTGLVYHYRDVLAVSLVTAVDAAREAYTAGATADSLMHATTLAQIRKRLKGCRGGSIGGICSGINEQTAVTWSAAESRVWFETRVELSDATAVLLESLGCHGALLLAPAFAATVIPAFRNSITPILARRLLLEVTRLRFLANGGHGCDAESPALLAEFEPSAPPEVSPDVEQHPSPLQGGADPSQTQITTCCVCLAEPAEQVCVPCGHRTTCTACMQRIRASSQPRCPLCREPIREAVRLFNA